MLLSRRRFLYYKFCAAHHDRAFLEDAGEVFIYLFYIEQSLVRGAQFSEAGLNGALMKRKNNTKNNNTKQNKQKKWNTKYSKSIVGSIWLGSKVPFRPNPNLFKSCSLLRARGSMFQILALLNLKEPWPQLFKHWIALSTG